MLGLLDKSILAILAYLPDHVRLVEDTTNGAQPPAAQRRGENGCVAQV